MPSKPQHCPYQPQPQKYRKSAQDSIPEDDSPHVNAKWKKKIQQIIGIIFYYARAVNLIILMSLSTILNDQAQAAEKNG